MKTLQSILAKLVCPSVDMHAKIGLETMNPQLQAFFDLMQGAGLLATVGSVNLNTADCVPSIGHASRLRSMLAILVSDVLAWCPRLYVEAELLPDFSS